MWDPLAEAVYGEFQACTQGVQRRVRESRRGRIEEHRLLSALCEMRCAIADDLHRKERLRAAT